MFVNAVGTKSFNSNRFISFSSEKEESIASATKPQNDTFIKQKTKEEKHRQNASNLIIRAVGTGLTVTMLWVLTKYIIYKTKRTL
ncbi:MAG: hypothetical protein KHX03_01230 [Clostridium sp.]|nr:hypothetical protein [Clostridium sp.]